MIRYLHSLSKGRYDETFAGEDGDFQQRDFLTSVVSDEHMQPPFRLRTSKRSVA